MAELAASRLRAALALLQPRRFFLETWRTLDEQARAERAQHDGHELQPLVVLVTACVSLTLIQYLGSAFVFADLCDYLADQRHSVFFTDLRKGPHYVLWQLGYWASLRVLGYLVIPALVARHVLRERLREHGLCIAGLREAGPLVALLISGALLLVWAFSQLPAFQAYYPFYREAGRSYFDLGLWELCYVAQFFALEFFFRGFLVLGCRRSLGSHAAFVSLLPYCMIHFGKPWPETLGAIGAGLVFATLAQRTRSIASGFVIHAVIAVAMDLASLARLGQLPSVLFS
ncbi:MAG TPA: CPBP family intramembrane glutamic endopeptidase [Polyangiales bacterium]